MIRVAKLAERWGSFVNERGPFFRRYADWLALAGVLAVGYFTYFHRYDFPQAPFWDENYYIADAQKYLHGVFFMQPHPPLGKLLIALGEKWVGTNAQTDQLITTDYAASFPSGFTFTGYRFFPALFSWWSAGLFWLVLRLLLRRPWLSALLASLYLFDNALIVHQRGAQIEATLIFFFLASLVCFLLAVRARKRPVALAGWAGALGAATALTILSKMGGIVLLFLLLPLGWCARRCRSHWLSAYAGGFWVAFFLVWGIHFSLLKRVQPSLPKEGFYAESVAQREDLARGEGGSWFKLGSNIREAYRYMATYNRGIPTLDLCRWGENGSPVFFWPFGARTINYRWETADQRHFRLLYLVPNPAVWACGLAGLLLSAFWGLAGRLIPSARRPRRLFWIAVLSGLYVLYMGLSAIIPRVLYLYHYLIPLLLSLVLFGLNWIGIRHWGAIAISPRARRFGSMGLALGIFGVFLFFSPLTYYRAMTREDLQKRSWLRLWDLRHPQGPSTGYFKQRAPTSPRRPLSPVPPSPPSSPRPR